MLWQIKKVLHCHFSDLYERLSILNDPRIGPQFTIEEMVMAALVLFLLKCDSRNAFNLKASDEKFRQNYYHMFHLRLPGMDAVNDLLEKIDPKELVELRYHFIHVLIEKRVFHHLRFFGKYFYIAIDGTGAYNWGDSPPEGIQSHALKKESKNGVVSYSGQMLEAVLICSNGMYIPLLTEWIANDGQPYVKQDCEIKAFKRLSAQLKQSFPQLPVCVVADGLYSNVSIMDVCKDNKWAFITVFKDGNLPSVWEEVEQLLPLGSPKERSLHELKSDSTYWIDRDYQWIKDIPYKKHTVNWIECVQKTTNRKTKEEEINRFVFLTNIDVNHENIISVLMAGRARWWIEEHFNTQKNRGGALHHKFNYKNFDALKNWHSIRQLACMMLQLITHTSELQQLKATKGVKMTWKELWENLKAYLSMHSVEDVIADFEHWSKTRRQVRLE